MRRFFQKRLQVASLQDIAEGLLLTSIEMSRGRGLFTLSDELRHLGRLVLEIAERDNKEGKG